VVTEEGASVRDLNSRNSTVVNNQRLRKAERILSAGDELLFSDILFRVELRDETLATREGGAGEETVAVPGLAPEETLDFPDGRTQVELHIPGLG
jgi:pSer/pThr/pTyr-binding forkhead associated (FHA) protein